MTNNIDKYLLNEKVYSKAEIDTMMRSAARTHHQKAAKAAAEAALDAQNDALRKAFNNRSLNALHDLSKGKSYGKALAKNFLLPKTKIGKAIAAGAIVAGGIAALKLKKKHNRDKMIRVHRENLRNCSNARDPINCRKKELAIIDWWEARKA
jgi:hypothetical protein